MVVRLHLVGAPRFQIDRKELVLQPRTVAECFALIASRKAVGITREELAGLLWPQLEPSNARAQLRQALTALRAQLQGIGALHIAEFGPVRLSLNAEIVLDTDVPHEPSDVDVLKHLLGPICEGWNRERWQPYADEVASRLGQIIPNLSNGEQLEILKQAVAYHPESPLLAQLHINCLVAFHRVTEANEAFIAFENAWVDRFGAVEIPRLSIPPAPILPVDQPSPISPETSVASGIPRRVLIAGMVIVVTSMGLILPAIARNPKTARLSSGTLDISSVSRSEHTLGATTLQQTVLGITQAEVIEHRLLSDRSIYLIAKGEQGAFLVQEPRIRAGKYRLENTQIEDRLGPQELRYDRKGKGPLRVRTLSTEGSDLAEDWVIPPTEKYPNFDYHRLIAFGELVFSRECNHPERCHKRLFHGVEGELRDLSAELGNPRIALFTARVGSKLYGKYSFGKSERWRYRSFAYDTEARSMEKLEVPPIIGASGSGHLFCLPETTVERSGSFDTRWNGTVLIIDPLGRQKVLSIGGQTKFFGAYWLGDGLAVACSDAPFEKDVKVVDQYGYLHVALTKAAAGTVFHSGVFLDPGCFLSQKQGAIHLFR